MKPIEMQKGKKLRVGYPPLELRKFELVRMDKSPRRKNWKRNIDKAIPKIMRHPFDATLMGWRFGTGRDQWKSFLVPSFLKRLPGGCHEASHRH